MLFTWLKRWSDFKGRSSRKEYWLGVLSMILLTIGARILDALAFGSIDFEGSGPLSILLGLALIIPSLALQVRRLHDIGKTGWWVLIGLIPLVGGLVLLVFSLMKGQPHDNAYGAAPPETPDLPQMQGTIVS